MGKKISDVNTVIKRNRIAGRKSKVVSVSLSEDNIENLKYIKSELGTYNRSHSISALIEKFSFKEEKENVLKINSVDLATLLAMELDVEDSVHAYKSLFQKG